MRGDAFLPGTGRGTASEGRGGGAATGDGPAGLPLHQAAARLGPPPRSGEEFAHAAARLAGFAGALLGWSPDAFWRATPAELAAIVVVMVGQGDGDAPPDAATIAALRKAFPDG